VTIVCVEIAFCETQSVTHVRWNARGIPARRSVALVAPVGRRETVLFAPGEQEAESDEPVHSRVLLARNVAVYLCERNGISQRSLPQLTFPPLLTKLKLTTEVAGQVWDLGAGGEEVRRIVKE
jgi:hypothetical protein